MKVREIMTTDLVTVPPSATISEAARLMRDADIGNVLVVDDSRLVGILTDRDITVRVTAEELDPHVATVGEFMSTDLITGLPDWDVEDAADILGEEQIRRLPIVEDGRPVGIISLGDVAVSLMREGGIEAEAPAAEALEEISEPARPRIGNIQRSARAVR